MSGLETSIGEIVETIWTSALQMSTTPDDPFLLEREQGRTFAGVVQITGAWNGAVAVQCSELLARRATTAMMGMEDADIGLTDIQDTLGELANMTGGNIKALMPETCAMGLPVVVEGGDFRLRVPGSVQLLQCAYRAGGEPFSVTVLQRAGAA
ncbi:MAG: chemotaxis protein CheX [Gemmatimonadota bacterium]